MSPTLPLGGLHPGVIATIIFWVIKELSWIWR